MTYYCIDFSDSSGGYSRCWAELSAKAQSYPIDYILSNCKTIGHEWDRPIRFEMGSSCAANDVVDVPGISWLFSNRSKELLAKLNLGRGRFWKAEVVSPRGKRLKTDLSWWYVADIEPGQIDLNRGTPLTGSIEWKRSVDKLGADPTSEGAFGLYFDSQSFAGLDLFCVGKYPRLICTDAVVGALSEAGGLRGAALCDVSTFGREFRDLLVSRASRK